jgi:RNA polymerase sigma-70 factor (ECF subfamily)
LQNQALVISEGDLELTAILAAQDPDELAHHLYKRYFVSARSISFRILGDWGRAEDVVQEVFLSICTNIGQFNPQRSSFRTWMFTAIHNRSIDRTRGKWAHIRQECEISSDVPAKGIGSDPCSETVTSIELERVRKAMATLSSTHCKTLELLYLGYSPREIAERTSTPLNTVKSRIREGRKRLRLNLLAWKPQKTG